MSDQSSEMMTGNPEGTLQAMARIWIFVAHQAEFRDRHEEREEPSRAFR